MVVVVGRRVGPAPGRVVGVPVGVRAVAVALLAQHGEPQERARLLERGQGEAVGHVADVDAVHLANHSTAEIHGQLQRQTVLSRKGRLHLE